jgi:nucleoid-associated protein YgaU
VKDFLKNLKLNEDRLTNLLTAVVMVLVAILLVGYFRSVNRPTTSSANTEISEEKKAAMTVEEAISSGFPSEYTIKKGDTLWKIADKAYGTGFEWVEIFQANKETLKNPNHLVVGSKITLPVVEYQEVSHTVAKGENLWKIAQVECGNGYLWTKIATDNQIQTPRVIEPGWKLSIRCK